MKLVEVPRTTEKVRVLHNYAGMYGKADVKAGDIVEFVYKNAYDSSFWYGRRVSDEVGVCIPLYADVEIV